MPLYFIICRIDLTTSTEHAEFLRRISEMTFSPSTESSQITSLYVSDTSTSEPEHKMNAEGKTLENNIL